MPTYEYECTRCGLVFEEFKSITAPKRQRCPECRSRVELLVSGGLGLVFKGSGFYVNDSRGTKEPSTGTESAAASDDTPKTAQDKAVRTAAATGMLGCSP